MPDTLRLFIAIELPEDVLRALDDVQKRLRSTDSDRVIRWTSVDSIHLTLKFLGDVPQSQVGDIKRHLELASHSTQPFALEVRGIGAFADWRNIRVVWAGVVGQIDALHKLRDAVEREIAPLGYPTESRPFSPHLTIGRTRKEAYRSAVARLGGKLSEMKIDTIASWNVESVSLMQSDLRPSGAVYTQLAEYQLQSSP